MIRSKLLSRIKAAVTCAAVALTALTVPLAAPEKKAEAAGSDNYAKLLQYSLYFYDANMCGYCSSKTGISWRSDCHTSDEVPGGFHDAGDHVMFGLPQGYAASTLGWSYYEFKDAYTSTGQADHLKMITDYFCDFFKRSTKLNGDTVSNFLYQKGDGDEDHGYWGAPEKQTGSRKMFWTSNGASDIAAEYAAALAVNYINFGNSEDLRYAEALYRFSTQYNQVAKDGTSGFYDNSSCQDEQAWAAGWLYLATKKESYKNDCASKQVQYLGWVHGWETVATGAACIYAEITNDWSKVNNWMRSNFTGSNYYCIDDWGSARYNCSAQMTALIASKHSNADYTSWCKGQMDYILGNNPFNVCFVTGFASNSAKNTHHRAASGYQGYTGEYAFSTGTKTYHPTNGKTLIGALAGGPTQGGQYSDVIDDYKCNEVALDYNAGLVASAAGLYSIYKSGSVDSNITGVTKIYSGSTPVVTTAPITTTTTTAATTTEWVNPWQTTTSTTAWVNPWETTAQTTEWVNPWQTTSPTTAWENPWQTTTTTTTTVYTPPTPTSEQKSVNVNQTIAVGKFVQINIADVLPQGAKAEKFIVNLSGNISGISSTGASLSVTNNADNWLDLPGGTMNNYGNSGNYEYDVKSIQDYIDRNGLFQFGYWWGTASEITVNSIVCVYSVDAPVTTTTTTTTTTAWVNPWQTTTSTTAWVNPWQTTASTTAWVNPWQTTTSTTAWVDPNPSYIPDGTLYGDVNLDDEVTVSDVVQLNLHLLNKDKYPLSMKAMANADCVRSHDITSADNVLLMNYIGNIVDYSVLGKPAK